VFEAILDGASNKHRILEKLGAASTTELLVKMIKERETSAA
jgi:hypothetical protein